jgi:type I restriction enzyme S subunit
MMLYRPNNEITDSNFLLFALLSSRVQKNLHSKIGGSTVGHAKVDDIRFLQIPCPPTLPEQRAIAATLSDVDALLAKLDQFIAKKRDLKQAAMQQLLTGQTRLPGFSGEWEVVPLPDMSWFQEGPGVRTHQFRLSGVKLLNGTNISNGRLLLDSTIRYVSNDEAEGAYKHFLVDEGDILLATSGVTIEKLHEKVAVVKHEDIPLCMNTSTVRFKVSNTRLIASYLYLFLRSDVFKKQIGRQATGSAQLNFGPSHLKKVDIPLPPSLPEQTAIATVLSDMDAELAALEAHRDKTRALKQGMMHELLTGRIRLI